MSGDGEHQEEVSGGRDRVSNFHVADCSNTISGQPTAENTLSFSRLSFSPPAMTVFPLAFIVLSLSLLVCAADLYNVLQG